MNTPIDEQLAQRLNTPTGAVRRALGLPIGDPFATIVRACDAKYANQYGRTPTQWEQLHRQWLELARTQIAAATTCLEARIAFYAIPKTTQGDTLRPEALAIWQRFSLAEIEAATDIPHLHMALTNAPPHSHLTPNPRMRALERWVDMCTTPEDDQQVLRCTESGCESQEVIRLIAQRLSLHAP